MSENEEIEQLSATRIERDWFGLFKEFIRSQKTIFVSVFSGLILVTILAMTKSGWNNVPPVPTTQKAIARIDTALSIQRHQINSIVKYNEHQAILDTFAKIRLQNQIEKINANQAQMNNQINSIALDVKKILEK